MEDRSHYLDENRARTNIRTMERVRRRFQSGDRHLRIRCTGLLPYTTIMSDQDEDNSSLTSLVGVIFSKASSVETGMVVSPSGTASTSAAAADPVADLAALIRRAISQVDNLSLISDNDTLDDLPTTSLRAVLLRSIQAQVTARSQTPPGNFPKRAEVLQESKVSGQHLL